MGPMVRTASEAIASGAHLQLVTCRPTAIAPRMGRAEAAAAAAAGREERVLAVATITEAAVLAAAAVAGMDTGEVMVLEEEAPSQLGCTMAPGCVWSSLQSRPRMEERVELEELAVVVVGVDGVVGLWGVEATEAMGELGAEEAMAEAAAAGPASE